MGCNPRGRLLHFASGFTGMSITNNKHYIFIGVCFLQQIKDFGSPPLETVEKGQSIHKLRLRKLVWFISVSRNALVVIACAVLAFVLEKHDMHPFSLTCKL